LRLCGTWQIVIAGATRRLIGDLLRLRDLDARR
jgi:hypothetical protein